MEPATLLEAVQTFSDLNVCHQYMVNLKWPDGRITCPKCGGDRIGWLPWFRYRFAEHCT